MELGDAPPGPLPLDDPRVIESLALAAAVVPALAAARPVHAALAAWPLLADGLPCVGAAPGIPGYFEAVTDYGVTLAPLIARSLADEVTGAGRESAARAIPPRSETPTRSGSAALTAQPPSRLRESIDGIFPAAGTALPLSRFAP